MSLPEEPALLKDARAYLQAIEDLNRKINSTDGDVKQLQRTKGFYLRQLEKLQNKKEAG